MKNTKLFLKELADEVPVQKFKTIAEIYMVNLKKIFIKRTQRRLHNLIYTTICITTENQIKKLYIEFSKPFITHNPTYSELDFENSSNKSENPGSEEDKNRSMTDTKFIMGSNHQVHELNDKKKDRIVKFIQGIISKPYLKKIRKMFRKNTAKNVYEPEEIEEKTMRDKLNVCKDLSSDDEDGKGGFQRQNSEAQYVPSLENRMRTRGSVNPFLTDRKGMFRGAGLV
jgi:hypothetical protein